MLQSAKNLVKFVQKFNPSGEATITLGINRYDEIEALFYLNQGNGEKLFAQIMPLSTITMDTRSYSSIDHYIDLVGEIEGYKVKLTFVKEKPWAKPTPKEIKGSGLSFLSLVSMKSYFKRLTISEWLKFEQEFNKCDYHNDIVDWLVSNKDEDFKTIIGAAFTWSETADGGQYWMDIRDRKEDVV